MKFLVETRIPTDVGNQKLKDGSLMKEMQAYLDEIKPEAIYFALAHGKRTVYMVINIPSADKMPEIAEPLWLDWQAEVFVTPVMDAKEFEKAGIGIQKVLRSR